MIEMTLDLMYYHLVIDLHPDLVLVFVPSPLQYNRHNEQEYIVNFEMVYNTIDV